MPGDTLVPDAQFRATRAITIDAPPEAVWPWLVQVGCLRAGWYSNDLLDNLAHPSATTLVPGPPDPRSRAMGAHVPDSVRTDSPEGSLLPGQRLAAVEQARQRLAVDSEHPVDGNRTRLVTRIHAESYDWSHPVTALLGVVLMEDSVTSPCCAGCCAASRLAPVDVASRDRRL